MMGLMYFLLNEFEDYFKQNNTISDMITIENSVEETIDEFACKRQVRDTSLFSESFMPNTEQLPRGNANE